jgi:hypothetical protein
VWNDRESARRKRPGAAKKYDADELKKAIASVTLQERMTVRAAAAAIGMPTTSLQAHVGKGGPLCFVTVRVKPALTEEHKAERLRYVICFVNRPVGT